MKEIWKDIPNQKDIIMSLNTEQLELKQKVVSFLNSNEKGYFGIYGSGGTGKSYTICRCLENYNKKVLFLGATNKVTTVLKASLQSSGYKKTATIKTIDSFLKFKIEKDHENKPEITYKFPAPSEIPDLLIIDEISLISFQKFQLIERLKDNPDISVWVQNGINIHQKHNSLSCEFCNQTLPEGKINTLEFHFGFQVHKSLTYLD